MWLSHRRGGAQTHGRREAERGRLLAAGFASGSGHARAFRRASQMRQAQTAETGRADQATEGPRRVANSAPADGKWDEAGQHRRLDRHGARDKHGESVTSKLGPCRTSVSGRRNARAHRGRRRIRLALFATAGYTSARTQPVRALAQMKQSARPHSFGCGGAAGTTPLKGLHHDSRVAILTSLSTISSVRPPDCDTYFIFPLTTRIVLGHLYVRLLIVTEHLNLTTHLPRSMRVRSQS